MIDRKKIDLFFNDVLRKNLLPRMEYKGGHVFGSANIDEHNYASIYLPTEYGEYEQSKYYHTGDYKFIHFTSPHKLLSIVREKRLRMYDLESMDDKDEFDFANKALDLNGDPYKVSMIKRRIYSLSMCRFELETKEKSLSMWRQFGQDGNGVGLVLRFSKSNRNHWRNFVLS